jgi:hypothetical protein
MPTIYITNNNAPLIFIIFRNSYFIQNECPYFISSCRRKKEKPSHAKISPRPSSPFPTQSFPEKRRRRNTNNDVGGLEEKTISPILPDNRSDGTSRPRHPCCLPRRRRRSGVVASYVGHIISKVDLVLEKQCNTTLATMFSSSIHERERKDLRSKIHSCSWSSRQRTCKWYSCY